MWLSIDGLTSGGSVGDTRSYLGSGRITQKQRATRREAWTFAMNFIWEVFCSGQSGIGSYIHRLLVTECTKEKSKKISHFKLRPRSRNSRLSRNSSRRLSRSLRKSTGSSWERKQFSRTNVMLLISEVSRLFQQKRWKWVIQHLMTSIKAWRCPLTMEIISINRWPSYKVLPPWLDRFNKRLRTRELLNANIWQHTNTIKYLHLEMWWTGDRAVPSPLSGMLRSLRPTREQAGCLMSRVLVID